jgi:hypothetical protein
VPDFTEYAFPTPSGEPGVFDVSGLTGNGRADYSAAVEQLASQEGMTFRECQEWLGENKLRLHHYGGDEMQIVPGAAAWRSRTPGECDREAGMSAAAATRWHTTRGDAADYIIVAIVAVGTAVPWLVFAFGPTSPHNFFFGSRPETAHILGVPITPSGGPAGYLGIAASYMLPPVAIVFMKSTFTRPTALAAGFRVHRGWIRQCVRCDLCPVVARLPGQLLQRAPHEARCDLLHARNAVHGGDR